MAYLPRGFQGRIAEGSALEGREVIQLVLVYCLVASANTCIEALEQPLTPFACMMNAQFVARQYVTEHPEWRLASWRCEVNVPAQKPA